MARTAQIHYKRVTFSFPAELFFRLREKVESQGMSKFVTEAVEEKMAVESSDDSDELMSQLAEFRRTAVRKTTKSVVELLRKDRYGKR